MIEAIVETLCTIALLCCIVALGGTFVITLTGGLDDY